MPTRIKFNCPLPLLVSSPDSVYEIWVDYRELTQAWHVVVGKLGNRDRRSITLGNPTRDELEQALRVGVDLATDPDAQVVALELVSQQRAEFVPVAA